MSEEGKENGKSWSREWHRQGKDAVDRGINCGPYGREAQRAEARQFACQGRSMYPTKVAYPVGSGHVLERAAVTEVAARWRAWLQGETTV